jgi:branched-chain amino acid transport system ATP-binding protein
MSPDGIVERGLIHVPEGRKIFPNMSVRENLELGSYRRAKVRRGENLAACLRCFLAFKNEVVSWQARSRVASSRCLQSGAV